jgi:hypothetical protein
MLRRGVGLALLVGGGLGVYGGVIVLSGAAKLSDVTGMLKRERRVVAPTGALTKGAAAADNAPPPETLSSSL